MRGSRSSFDKAFLLVMCALMATAAIGGEWVWFPGDFETSLSERVHSLRLERGGLIPPMSPLYSHWSVVTFRKSCRLESPERIRIEVDGEALAALPGTYAKPFRGVLEYDLPAGEHMLWFRVMNRARVPSLRVTGRTVNTDGSWQTAPNNDVWEPVATGPAGQGDDPPGAFALPRTPIAAVSREETEAGTLYDFGQESMGAVRLDGIRGSGRVKVVYGESREEALGADADIDAYEFADVKDGENFLFPVARAFRFVCVRRAEGVTVGSVSAAEEMLPIELKGSFECDDEELNRIWRVSARTLHLTAREFFLDGIKRDRWTWGGDAHQSFLMGYYLFGADDIMRRTIRCLRGKDPVMSHLNCIPDYTLYWFSSVRDYRLFSGDDDFVRAVYPSMKTMMDYCIRENVNADGFFVGRPHDWVFIDWTPEPLENTGGATAFLQILFVRALESIAEAATVAGDAAGAEAYAKRARDLRSRVVPTFWNEERGGLMHIRLDSGAFGRQFTRHPNMFALADGYFTPERAARVTDGVLFNDAVMKIQTPYMRFYELASLCANGRQDQVRREMKAYWGGMLKLGATSFWELYNPAEKGAAHYAMYGRPFGRSLCHAWGASPLYLIGRYFLGVEPTSPGFRTYRVRPCLGGLKWMRGRVPTPYGPIEVSVKDGSVNVKGPKECKETVVSR